MREGFRIDRFELGREPRAIVGLALALAVRGEPRARFEADESIRLAAGDVLVVRGGSGGALSSGRGRADVIVFRAQGEWLARALELAGTPPEPALPRAATLRAGTQAARQAAQSLRTLGEDAQGHDAGAPFARAARALELLGIAAAARPDPAPAAPRRTSPRAFALEQALEALRDAPLQELTLGRFAAGLGYSERQASRQVRERLGCSFGAHLAALRLARAERLLAESELPVIQVAAEAGFGSLAHFNQRFRERTGRTPSAFRAVVRSPSAPPRRAPAPA
jgi:AraC-like DNA-binding protein